ncbi:MAG: hypothetical protein V4596_14535 [Bdellovibrionota bacterium]
MKYLLAFVFMFVANAALASTQWDSCSSSDGTVTMLGSLLSIEGIGEIGSESVKVTVLSTVKDEQEKCWLKNHRTEVISYENKVTVEEVEYTTEENDSPSKSILICERGGSGIPANDECE